MSTYENELASLAKFVSSIGKTDSLKVFDKDNVFDILQITEWEIKHSQMLAYLCNPSVSGSVGKTFLKELLTKISKNPSPLADELRASLLDLLNESSSSITVSREYFVSKVHPEKNDSQIDLVIVFKKQQFIITIENKINAKEDVTSNQLQRYQDRMQAAFPTPYKHLRLFLTPRRDMPSIPTWLEIDYKDVCESMKQVQLAPNTPDSVKHLINDYEILLRRDYMEDEEFKDICIGLYFDHKKAIDLIRENCKMEAVVAQKIREVADKLKLKAKTTAQAVRYHTFTDAILDAKHPNLFEIEVVVATDTKKPELFLFPKLRSDDANKLRAACTATGFSPNLKEFQTKGTATKRELYYEKLLNLVEINNMFKSRQDFDDTLELIEQRFTNYINGKYADHVKKLLAAKL
ncbi:MAG: PD-(D/E)XK nuclease family protein [Firmicutes bacterium]|nr:PD-(D/E)XK nuclease family protein [Bacillota bacterium]